MSTALGRKPTLVATSPVAITGLFLAILGAKLWVIHTYGSCAPFGDDWDLEGDLYNRYVSGTLQPADFFAPQNEHRVAFTRLLGLAQLEVSGGWDVQFQMVVNAILLSAVAALTILTLRSALNAVGWFAAVLATGIFFCLPFGWENTLWATQSQFYFLIGLSLLALYLLVRQAPLSPLWFVGVVTAAASMFTMASGLLLLPVAIGFHVVRIAIDDGHRVKQLVAALLLTVLAAALSLTLVHVPYHDALRAHSIGEFLASFVAVLEWPIRNSPLDALALWHPSLVLAGVLIVRRAPATDRAWYPVVVAGWVMAQCAAIAFARTGGAAASRYLDIVAIGVVFNIVCALILLERLKGWKRIRTYAIALTLIAIALGVGAANRIHKTFPGMLEARHAQGVRHEARLERYMRTGDVSALEGAFPDEVPYPGDDRVASTLRSETMRGLMPEPLGSTRSEGDAANAHLKLHGALAAPTAQIQNAMLAFGGWLMAIGAMLLTLAMVFLFRAPARMAAAQPALD